VLGEDDDEDSNVIELGDTRDYGDEDAVDDDQTGILGIGVVEYDDDVEEIDELEDYESGLEDLPGAPELTPAEISALFAKAEEAGRRNMADGVLLFSDVLDADPHRSDALLARGRLYLDLGDFPGAISDFLKAEALHPRDPDAQVALGDLFQGRKDYGKAVSYYTRALSIDADHAPALARRGMAHYFRRQHSAAEEDLERAKKLDPSLPLVDTYLARLRKK
jgi:tetratricopeptide (TPR) repeat protein